MENSVQRRTGKRLTGVSPAGEIKVPYLTLPIEYKTRSRSAYRSLPLFCLVPPPFLPTDDMPPVAFIYVQKYRADKRLCHCVAVLRLNNLHLQDPKKKNKVDFFARTFLACNTRETECISYHFCLDTSPPNRSPSPDPEEAYITPHDSPPSV